jgi:SAM-dependent methyltransferase
MMAQPQPLSTIQQAVLRCLSSLRLPPGARLLDAPCGAGALASVLLGRGFDVIGADVEGSAEHLLGPRFAHADFNQRLPWPDAHFDAIFAIEGIEHLENRFFFLREARRILRPGGRLILTTPNVVALRSRVRFFASGFYHRDSRPMDESQHRPLHHIGLATFSDLRYALHTSGFSLDEVRATHIKPVSWPYAVFVPWMFLYTLAAFRKEKDPAQQARNRTIRRTLFSPALLFGENLLLVAVSHNRDKEL